MKQKQKRYQYWSKDGIVWTEWFNVPMNTPEEKWQVTPEEIKMTAEKYKLKYFETSAKTKKNIHEGFNYIVNSAYSKLKESKNVIIDLNDDTKKKSGGCFGKKKK